MAEPTYLEFEIKRLTPAQYRAVRSGSLMRGRGYWPLKQALVDKKLFTSANGRDVLTPLGQTLRERLLAQAGGQI